MSYNDSMENEDKNSYLDQLIDKTMESILTNQEQASNEPVVYANADEYRKATNKRFRVSPAQKAEIDAGNLTRQEAFLQWQENQNK